MKIIIPARLGSKGLPFKNRKLFDFTAGIIPIDKQIDTWVTTNDDEIISKSANYNFNIIKRPAKLSSDTTSLHSVISHALSEMEAKTDELILVLYLTYPERTWKDVLGALDFFFEYYGKNISTSMLCRKETKTHPYLCLTEYGEEVFGRQFIQHDLYRRQDYPKCFELSHYICLFRADTLFKLNNNLYNNDTIFHKINDVIDIDTKDDLIKYGRSKN